MKKIMVEKDPLFLVNIPTHYHFKLKNLLKKNSFHNAYIAKSYYRIF